MAALPDPYPTRLLGTGTAGLPVSAIGLGCMGMSEFYGPGDDARSVRVIQVALGLGVAFFDTADMYGPFTNEQLLGRALSGRRDDAVIATKFGNERRPDGTRRVNGRPEYVRQACDASLSRLGVDVLDLYYQHRVDRDVPVEETWGAMHDLVEAGKVRCLGISEAAPDTIRRAHRVHPITAVQTEWSLWTRDVEVDGVLATVRELGVGFVAYSPLGRGFLTGDIGSPDDLTDDDVRRLHPRFQAGALDANLALVRLVQELAADQGVTAGQLALAWLLAQGEDVVPIPGTKRESRLRENAGAVNVSLSPEDLARIDRLVPVGSATGDRYADMSTVHV